MTESELNKFIENTDSETAIRGEEAFIWIHHFDINEFTELLGSAILDEGGMQVTLQENYVCCDLNHICDFHGIDINKIVTEDE